MIVYRHADPRFPFLWESANQPESRWHGPGGGPVQYFADTPDGAWAEFLRHEGITKESELVNIRRALWAIELVDDLGLETPRLARKVLTGGVDTYRACQTEARRLRDSGAKGLRTLSAALLPGAARGWRVEAGLHPAGERDGIVIALFGTQPHAVGWATAALAYPRNDVLRRVRHLPTLPF
jgi:hypothetical protein